jgi:hypothetical protein
MKKMKKIMQLITIAIPVIFILVSAIESNQRAAVYYVDTFTGNDSNDGTSASSAWESISAVNGKTFEPGDRILFRSGGIWNENLILRGSGVAGKPVVIDKYGKGDKPAIIGQEQQGTHVINLSGVEYWEINNLDISGKYAVNGIYIAGGKGRLNHFRIRECEIHDLTMGGGYSRGNGIRINGRDLFNDIRIENNFIHDVSGDGIMVNGDASLENITKLYVGNNTLINVAGDGIIIRDAKAPVTEYNYVNNCGYANYSSNAGIWCAFTDSAVFQYNECCFVKKPQKNNDGMSFDSDIGAIRTIFQYNYSHDNDGGFHLCMRQAKNTIMRYNISQNDKLRLFYQGFTSPECLIYNNVFYGPALLSNKPEPGGKWSNNIFWSTEAQYTVPELGSNNITWGNASGGKHIDPMLVDPGNGGTKIDMTAKNRLSGYRLKKGSPCIDAGIVVPENGGKDFWGKSLYKGVPDIGVMEF